jgi:hypothetical protein
VKPVDQFYEGTGHIVFGPIKIHPETKLTLEKALLNGGMTIPVNLVTKNQQTR